VLISAHLLSIQPDARAVPARGVWIIDEHGT